MLRRWASKLRASPDRGWGNIPRPGGRSGDARLCRRAVILLCCVASIGSPLFANGTFNEAMKACSSVGDHVHRLDILHGKGWHLILPSTALAATYGDSLAVANPPKENSIAAWENTRAWSRDLMPSFFASAVSVARKSDTLLALGPQRLTDAPTCFLMTVPSEQSEVFLTSLKQADRVNGWGYGLRGQSSVQSTSADGRNYRTDVSIMLVKRDALPDLPSPLHPTLTVSFVTKPVR